MRDFIGCLRANVARLRLAAVSIPLLAAALAPAPARAEWVSSWTAAPIAPTEVPGGVPSFSDQTLRQVVRLSAGGRALRIRLSNAYGAAPLVVGALRVARLDANGQELAGTSRKVTFAGAAGIAIAPGASALSDPVPLDLPALSTLAVLTYLPTATGPCTCHQMGLEMMDIVAGEPAPMRWRGSTATCLPCRTSAPSSS